MAFTRTWNTAYEAIPADVEAISLGASRIRNLKSDIKERAEIDHSWAGNDDDGKHKQVTFVDPLASDPATVTDQGFLYTKNVSSKAELHWRDEDGNVSQLTSAGSLNNFPSGTKMLFQQTAAPTGWTKDTTAALNNTALRIVTGTVGSGGTHSFTTVFNASKTTNSHALTVSQIPAHNHDITVRAASGGGTYIARIAAAGSTTIDGSAIANEGGSQSHTHNMTMDLQYNDVIIASKD